MESDIALMSQDCSEIQDPTVLIRNGCKYYGSKNKVIVLQNLNLTVPKGIIYGLLGSSGCGKTTLLSCIIGRKKLNSGEIWVLGGTPGTKGSKVPGPHIGYMPQVAGVQYEFSTRETMTYFGQLAGLESSKIKERICFLEKLLMLPNIDRRLGNVSGGEQRRISFAVALIHEPELLILDEPTVGLDPILRESIWNYLYDITTQRKTTVILTTHYIDEARHASVVALLREGKLLSEEAPDSLMSKLSANTLEEAFFILSSKQNANGDLDKTIKFLSDNADFDSLVGKYNRNTTYITSKRSHLKPLLLKNIQWLIKNPTLILFSILLPVLQLFFFYVAVGHDPLKLNLAISNNETSLTNCGNITCDSDSLSCNFLQYLHTPLINLNYYGSTAEAVDAVFKGKADASISFKHNYTLALKKRIKLNKITEWDIPYSTVDVVRDVSTYNVALFSKVKIIETFYDFMGDYLGSCGMEKNLLSVPLKWNDPVYGQNRPDFAEFAVPALVLSSLSFFSSWAIVSSLLTEKSYGIADRMLVMGVTPLNIMISHVITESLLVICHIIGILSCMFGIMKLTLYGQLSLVILMFVVMSLWGLSFGIFLATVCTTDALASYVVTGVLFPAGLLSGVVWPVEGMSYGIRIIASILPFSRVADSVRSISHRAWDLSHPQLYTSIICVTVWVLLFLAVSIAIIRIKKY